jgi:hypothetical protein
MILIINENVIFYIFCKGATTTIIISLFCEWICLLASKWIRLLASKWIRDKCGTHVVLAFTRTAVCPVKLYHMTRK